MRRWGTLSIWCCFAEPFHLTAKEAHTLICAMLIVSLTLLYTVREEQGEAVAPFMKKRPKDFSRGAAPC